MITSIKDKAIFSSYKLKDRQQSVFIFYCQIKNFVTL